MGKDCHYRLIVSSYFVNTRKGSVFLLALELGNGPFIFSLLVGFIF